MTLNTEGYGIYTTSQRPKQHLLDYKLLKVSLKLLTFNPYIIYSRVNLGRV